MYIFIYEFFPWVNNVMRQVLLSEMQFQWKCKLTVSEGSFSRRTRELAFLMRQLTVTVTAAYSNFKIRLGRFQRCHLLLVLNALTENLYALLDINFIITSKTWVATELLEANLRQSVTDL